MANIRTIELDTSNTIASSDTVIANVGNVTKKVPVSVLLNGAGGGGSSFDPIGTDGETLQANTNLNSCINNGVFYATSDVSSTITNKPTGVTGTFKMIVLTPGYNTIQRAQILFSYNNSDTTFTIWHRCRISGSNFTAWESGGSGDGSGFDPIGSNGTELSANDNLNSLTYPGVYYATAANASTITNKPDGVSGAFKLLILRTGTTSGYQAQILFGYVDNVTLTIWYRGASNNGTYTVWYTAGGGGGGSNYATRIDTYNDLFTYLLTIPAYGVAPFKVTGSLASEISGGAITTDFYGFVTRDQGVGNDNIYVDFYGTYLITDTNTTPTTYHSYGAHLRSYLRLQGFGSVVFCNKTYYKNDGYAQNPLFVEVDKTQFMSIYAVQAYVTIPAGWMNFQTPDGYRFFEMSVRSDNDYIVPYQTNYVEADGISDEGGEYPVAWFHSLSSEDQSFYANFKVIYIRNDSYLEPSS